MFCRHMCDLFSKRSVLWKGHSFQMFGWFKDSYLERFGDVCSLYQHGERGAKRMGNVIGMSPGKMFGSIGNCTDDHNRFLDVFGLFLESWSRQYMAISLSEVYNSEKTTSGNVQNMSRNLGVSYGFLHFLMVNPWVSDFPSTVALHSSSWNPKACEATGAVSGVQQPYNLLVGDLEPWNFMTFHILGI